MTPAPPFPASSLHVLPDFIQSPTLFPPQVIIVEWNPPTSSPSLASIVKWPRRSFHVPLRIITVHHAAAATLDFLHRDPFPQVSNLSTVLLFYSPHCFQFYAKNIAIRRALGRWLLITNADILLGDDLHAFISERTLDTGSFYRIDRHDLHMRAQVPSSSVRQGKAQEYCIDHVASVMTMTTMGVGGVLIDDMGVSPDKWGAYNVTQWGHLRVRFGDDGSGQLGFKVETKSGGSRGYWNMVTDVYKRGDGELVVPSHFEDKTSYGHLQGCLSSPSPTTADPARCVSCTPMPTATSCNLLPRPCCALAHPRAPSSYTPATCSLLPRAAALAVRGYAEVPLPIFVDSQLSAQVQGLRSRGGGGGGV